MEKSLAELYRVLQKLTGLHRQLLEVVRAERVALVDADVKEIQNCTNNKQIIIETIHGLEASRLKLTGELAMAWKRPFRELTLPNIAVAIQHDDAKGAEQLRSYFNVLTILIARITEQNSSNLALIEKSLAHIHQMKTNILGEASATSSTYTPSGQKTSGRKTPRILSKEA